MTNQGAVIYSVNSHLDQYVSGTHHHFNNPEYNAYKVIFDVSGGNPRTNNISFALFNRNNSGRYLTLLSYRNIHNSTMLELIKEHQHIGNWNGDMFVITNSIKRRTMNENDSR